MPTDGTTFHLFSILYIYGHSMPKLSFYVI